MNNPFLMEFFQVNIFFVNQANKLNHFKMSNFTHFNSNISNYENNHVTLNYYTKWHNLIIHTIETYIKTLDTYLSIRQLPLVEETFKQAFQKNYALLIKLKSKCFF
jgi:hypothetical protein